MHTKLEWYGEALSNLGPIHLLRRQLKQLSKPQKPYRLSSKYSYHPLLCRPGTTDLLVFDQIFVELQYRCLDGLDLQGLILDCGANAGYSSAYLLSQFPKSKLLAIEPDPENFAILDRNMESFGIGNRVLCVQAAVWSHSTKMAVDPNSKSLGQWGLQFIEGIGSVKAVDIATILKGSDEKRIALLKMDIEGAEEQVFAGDTSWLSVTDNIVIELHGNKCESVFMSAVADQGFKISRSGELTVCRR